MLLVARHFHHLLDGAVLVTRLERPIHIVVGLDWTATSRQRHWMEWACRAADYPVVLRASTIEESGAYQRAELLRYTRRALHATTRLLRAGRVVLVFAEGYPNIDPRGSRKDATAEWLPFAPGFLKMIEFAERDEATHVALVPVGFHYAADRHAKWSIETRIGEPVARNDRRIGELERIVRNLSSAPQANLNPISS